MGNLAGSLRKVVLDGTTFSVFADANIDEVGSAYENDAIPTSGDNIRKMIKRVETREGVVIACNGAERDMLKDLAERREDFPMSYETAAGDVYRCTGWIEFEKRETEEIRASIKLIPRQGWESFLAD